MYHQWVYVLGQDVPVADMPGISVPVGCQKSEASLVDVRLLKKIQPDVVGVIILEK